VLRQVIAATYHQVWWPSTEVVRYDGDELPVWDEDLGTYLDPATGEVLPTWDQALDAIGPHDDPLHVARFGARFDAQGVLAGSNDANRCIRYLTKYLTKQVADCHQADTDPQRGHMQRLADALRYEPCSPTCANWLRYGIQPKSPNVCASEKSPGVLDQLPQPGSVIVPVRKGGAGSLAVSGLAGGGGRLVVWSGARRW
jgi:hypothetical protein